MQDLLALRRHQTRLETVRDELTVENQDLAGQVGRLKSDDRYLERLIRRELGYARSNELIYRFAGSAANNP